MKFRRRLRSKSGFSLVECMIAILVFSIMSMLIAAILNTALMSHRRNMEKTRELKDQRDALMKGGADIESRAVTLADPNFNFGNGLSVKYHLEVQVAKGENDLELSSLGAVGDLDPTRVASMKLSNGIKDSDGKALLDVTLSSPAYSFDGYAGLTGVEVYNESGAGAVYKLTGTGSYTGYNGKYGNILRVSVSNIKGTVDMTKEHRIAINILTNVPGMGANPVLGVLAKTNASNISLYAPGSDTSPFTEVDDLGVKIKLKHYQIVLTKPASDLSFPEYTFVIVSENEVEKSKGGIVAWLRL